jgi:excisionase family DNA binding protein
MERRTYTVEEAAKMLGIGRSMAYEAVRTGQIKGIRIGARVLIPKHVIDRLLDAQETEPASAAQ